MVREITADIERCRCFSSIRHLDGEKMDGRNAQGQFVKGHQLSKGKGRPKRNTEEKYLKVFSDTVKEEDLKEILQTVMARAKAADMVAARIIFDYALGKPAQQLTVDVVSDLNIALVWSEDDNLDDSPSGVA